MNAQFLPIADWAKQQFGDASPKIYTLRLWAREGKIDPLPRKVGRAFFCRSDARYIDPKAERLERMSRGS